MINSIEISVAAMHVQNLATSLNYLKGVLTGGVGNDSLMDGAFGESVIDRLKSEIELAQSAINAVNYEINNKNNSEVSE